MIRNRENTLEAGKSRTVSISLAKKRINNRDDKIIPIVLIPCSINEKKMS